MILRRSLVLKYSVLVLGGALLYSEWFVYKLQPFFWPRLSCAAGETQCTRILFVADPQIQGDYAEPLQYFKIYSWDSDRFLRSTFSVVLNHFKPDVIVYLGDLMDEGSVCTIKQFHTYAKRLLTIFDIDYPVVQVWIPGDNDIGGENEPIRQSKVEEFSKVFQKADLVTAGKIGFLSVNGITRHVPNITDDQLNALDYRIVVSHYPVTNKVLFGREVNTKLRPHIYFCAHDHESKYAEQSPQLTERRVRSDEFARPLAAALDARRLLEVYVPTCSYRMGTSRIGYGAAVLGGTEGQLQYTVFWSPQRFPYLASYVVIIALLVLYYLVRVLCRCRSQPARGRDAVPLLKV